LTALVLPPLPQTELHQVAFRPGAVEPGMVEVAPEPVRVHPTPVWPPRRLTICWMAVDTEGTWASALQQRSNRFPALGSRAWLAIDVVK
jgi:hypothetical protein